MKWQRLFAEGEVNLRTEFLAGLTTFLTSAYIIAVNPVVLSRAGMDVRALFAVTCIATAIATLVMAAWPKVPVLMAPGMGLNAFFAITVCGTFGFTWQQALGFVFWAGLLFLALSFIGFREKIAAAIPTNLRLAGSVGIGVFIAFLGLRNLGLLRTDSQGMSHLGTVNGTHFLGLGGLILMGVLEARKVKGSLLIGILAVSVASMLLHFSEVPKEWISTPPSIMPLFAHLELVPPYQLGTIVVILTFLYVALFDGLGTILAVAETAGISKQPDYERKISRMLKADAIANMLGAVIGTSTVTAYIESNTGISQGGRTGWTAFFAAMFFVIALVLAPFVAVIPPFATAPALIMVGVLMVKDITRIKFDAIDEGLPALLTILIMPLTFSIANGLMFGFITYTVLKILLGKWKELNPVLIGIALFSLFNLIIGGRLI